MHVLASAALVFVVGTIAGSVIFNAVAYASAARYRRLHPPFCPLDEDDEPAPWPARTLAWLASFLFECAITAFLTFTVPLAFRRLRVRPVTDDEPGERGRPVVLLQWDPLESTCRHASLSIL